MERQKGKKLIRSIFLLLLIALLSFSPVWAYQPFEPFTFAYVTDVHLTNEVADSFKLTRESQLFLQELVKELNAQKVDFVIFGGDQVETIGKDEANWQLFLDVMQGLNAPWSFVLGETDVSGNFSVDKRKTFGPDWKQRGIETDTAYWSKNLEQIPNVHLIGLDTSMPNSTIGGVSKPQLDWLKKDLEANKKYFTIVFSHHPLLPPAPYDSGPPWDEYIIPDGGSVREILGQYPNVKMVLSGHTHVSKVQNEKDIWHISSPSLDVYPCAYRLFRVTPTLVTMETRQINFPALVKKGKKELIDSSLASRYSRESPDVFLEVVEGAKEDRDALIPLVPGKTTVMPYSPKKSKAPAPPPEEKPKKEKKRKKKNKEPEKPKEAQPEEKPKQPVKEPSLDEILKDGAAPDNGSKEDGKESK